jgi:hypothetical protein
MPFVLFKALDKISNHMGSWHGKRELDGSPMKIKLTSEANEGPRIILAGQSDLGIRLASNKRH